MQNIEISSSPKEEFRSKDETKGTKSPIRDMLNLLLSAGLIISLDQWTKLLIVEHIPFLGSWLPEKLAWLSPYARIVHWRNSGAAFGIFQNGNLIFIFMAFIATIFILVYFPMIEKKEWALRFAMVLQLGGALGNLIDRLRYGFVIDFISVGDFPVFNIADASISIGVAVLLLSIIIQEYKDRKAAQAGAESENQDPAEDFES